MVRKIGCTFAKYSHNLTARPLVVYNRNCQLLTEKNMNASTPTASSIIDEIKQIVLSPHSFRSVFILIMSLLVAYWLSRFLARGLIFIAQRIASRSDKESDEARAMRLRQTETYLSMFIAIVRALVVIVVGYIAWILLSPTAGNNSSGARTWQIGRASCRERV